MQVGVSEYELTNLLECTTQEFKDNEAYSVYLERKYYFENLSPRRDSYGGYRSSQHRYLPESESIDAHKLKIQGEIL
jgi:hypothetical protein